MRTKFTRFILTSAFTLLMFASSWGQLGNSINSPGDGSIPVAALATEGETGNYLPERDQWGVTMGFNGLGSTNWNLDVARTGSLLFRYYSKDCAAWRLAFSPYLDRDKGTTRFSENSAQDFTISEKSLELSVGYQNNFVSTPRINPYAGVDLYVAFGGMNTLTKDYATDTLGVFQDDEPWSQTEIKAAPTTTIGLSPFVGFEYYLGPKIAIGGEAYYNLGITKTGMSTTTNTYFDGQDENTDTFESGDSSRLNFGSQGTALITLSYYFWKRCCGEEMMNPR